MYGMLCVDLSTSLWLTFATAFELPVSTTHATIGGLVGFGLVNAGNAGVKWNDETSDFPYRAGLTPVVISWFVSPGVSAAFAATMASSWRAADLGHCRSLNSPYHPLHSQFLIVRHSILRRKNSLTMGFILVPFIFFGVVMANVVFILSKGFGFVIKQENAPYKDACKKGLRDSWKAGGVSTTLNLKMKDGNSHDVDVSKLVFSSIPPKFDGSAESVYINSTVSQLQD